MKKNSWQGLDGYFLITVSTALDADAMQGGGAMLIR
jgi:hypothetical protein